MMKLPHFGLPALPPPDDPAPDLLKVAQVLEQTALRGTMTAEDLRSLMETAPQLVTLITKNLNETWPASSTGVRWRRLMTMAHEGRLTADKIRRAIG